MLRQRIENIAPGAFLTPFVPLPATLIEPPVNVDDCSHMDCASAGCNLVVCSKVTQPAERS
jgi:hypothetical protein